MLLAMRRLACGDARTGRVRTEITVQTLNGQFGEFLVRALRMDDVFVAQFAKRSNVSTAPYGE